jgi:hypothetical protein
MSQPDCAICGQPYFAHVEIYGAGRICPVSAVSYRPKAPTDPVIGREGRDGVIEECARVADKFAVDGGEPVDGKYLSLIVAENIVATAKAIAKRIRALKANAETVVEVGEEK